MANQRPIATSECNNPAELTSYIQFYHAQQISSMKERLGGTGDVFSLPLCRWNCEWCDYESTHLARKSLPTTTLVIKDLVCGMADILWREEQLRQAFLELNVSDQTMTFIQLWSWKYSLQKALIQQISYIALASNTGFESRMCRGHCAYHAGVASFPGLACMFVTCSTKFA